MEKQAQMSELAKKYNLEALQDYNFDNFTFDIDFGDMSQKDVDRMKMEEKEYNEELKKKEAEKKKGKWLFYWLHLSIVPYSVGNNKEDEVVHVDGIYL